MKKQFSRSSIGDLFALLLLAVFATGILSVLMTGAGVYRRLVDRDNYAYTTRTAERYVTVKVRQAPECDNIGIEDFEGVTSLAIREDIDGVCFVTYIYHFDGYLRELFCEADSGLLPDDGEKILPLSAFEGRIDENMLFLKLTEADGSESELTLALRNAKEAK